MNSSIPTVDHPLSAKGRFGRLSLAAWLFVSAIIYYIVIFLFALTTGILDGDLSQVIDSPSSTIHILGILLTVFYITFFYLCFIFIIRRLHDQNQSGWLSLLVLIPFLNFIFLGYLLCVKGTIGENKFGAVRATLGWEKILGCIYIVALPFIVILSLIGITIPSYQNFIQKGQQIQIEQQLNQAE